MNPERLKQDVTAAAAAVGLAAAVAWPFSARTALGIAAGGGWNLASLWCLTRLLNAWLGPNPSRRRAVGWLLVKFPLLYLLVIAILRVPDVSRLGFSAGFTLVLAFAIGRFILQAKRALALRADGR